MQTSIAVENIKCGGCVSFIIKKLQALDGVNNVSIDLEASLVNLEIDLETTLKTVKTTLLKMGYPEIDTIDGLAATGAKAKSFVSCALGRLQK